MFLLVSTIWRFARQWPVLIVGYVTTSVALIALWIVDPLLARYVIDTVTAAVEQKSDLMPYLNLFLLWVGVSLTLSIFQAVHKMICWRTLNYIYCEFQAHCFEHILHMDVAQHTQRRAGAIIKKIDNAADQIWDLGFEIFATIIPSLIAGVLFLIFAFWINVELTLIVTIALGLYAVMLALITRKAHPLQSTISRIWVSVIGRAYDVAMNVLPMKSSTGEERELNRMKYWNKRGLMLQNRTDIYWGVMEGLNMFVLMRALMVGVGLYLIAGDKLTLGELFFFLFIIFRLISPIEVLGHFMPKWNEKMEKVRMGVFIARLPSIVKNSAHPQVIDDLKGEITFKNVSFSYEASSRDAKPLKEEEEEELDILDPRYAFEDPEEARRPHHSELLALINRTGPQQRSEEDQHAITDLSLTIKPGEKIALVGHSGAGKTTIAALVNRFYDVTNGAILIDGVDMKELDLYWWRKQIGLVMQDNIMFNDSILENIRYGRPLATKEEVIDAATRAGAHEFIKDFPKGYSTNIGERGVRLSGGERQRVSISRAILKQPKVVVLDEATSALDSVTEKHVQEGIASLVGGRTSIIIAHRLSTVRSADRIAVLDKGKLIDYAPHEELLQTCPIYKEMVELQSHGLLAE